MHWGHKIILVFTLFAVGMLTLVYKSMHAHVDMVTGDYYAEELQYQHVIDGRRNAEALSAPVNISQPGNMVEIQLPPEMRDKEVHGQLLFYRPSDSRKDIKVALAPDASGRQLVDRQHFITGPYRVKVQWEADHTAYFQEAGLYIR